MKWRKALEHSDWINKDGILLDGENELRDEQGTITIIPESKRKFFKVLGEDE